MDFKSQSRMKTTPVAVQRSMRNHDLRVLTSLPAGKMVPLAAFPVLREDSVPSMRARLTFEMMETVEVLMNAVNVNVKAYLVPNLAFERFSGMDELNRAYSGLPNQEGGAVTPYIETMAYGAYGANEIYKYMGLHGAPADLVNVAYIEAYNQIWNFRAKNRSPHLTLRARLATTLAPAFWQHQDFRHIVPDFDQAVMDGEVALNVVNNMLKVTTGTDHSTGVHPTMVVKSSTTGGIIGASNLSVNGSGQVVNTTPISGTSVSGVFPSNLWAELEENGFTLSLSNIDLARKTQAFAKLRAQYAGHTDEYIIDLLMQGIEVPEQAFRQPMLLADRNTVFGMSKRYATDSGNLTDSVVSGATFIDLALAAPRVPCGGVVMIVAEITPEQMFERQRDAYLHTTSHTQLPDALRDELDPEKVQVVLNGEIETSHTTPNGVFGYAPLHHKWAHNGPKIGGRFYRPSATTSFDEDRQRLWAIETANPTLGADFYICNQMHTKPFVVTNQDPFEVVMRGTANIAGNTVFGGVLVESQATSDYEKVMAKAPVDRINKP